MNNFIIDTPDNFWQIRWLDKYMEGHKGFIAGGCFKNILSGEKVKDIDIFFESEDDFQEAVDLFNDEKHQKEGWKFKYRNEKVCAFHKEGERVWIEFIESEFGKPEEILRSFDFTVAKMAYYNEFTRENVLKQLEEDVRFGFEKALNQRGISASLMFECVMMWNYILEEGLEGWGEDDYAFYGLPLFKATAVKYGWDNPIGEDSGRERKYDSQY